MPHHGVDPHRPPTAELQLQLFRIYASTSRQREWFRIHEENAKALLKMTESLHQRFFPGEPSPFRPPHDHDNDHRDDGGHGTHRAASITGVFTAPGQTATVKVKGLGDEECFVSLPPLLPGSAATDNGGPSHTSAPAFITTNETDEAVVGIYRAVPDFLLELTAEHIHECFGTEVATSAAAPSHVALDKITLSLVSLLAPLLRSLCDVAEMAVDCVGHPSTHWRGAPALGCGNTYTDVTDPHLYSGACSRDRFIATLCTVARHLFYLLHEVLSCMSLRHTTLHLLCQEEREAVDEMTRCVFHMHGVLLSLLSKCPSALPRDGHPALVGTVPVGRPLSPSTVNEAFDFLEALCLHNQTQIS
ncbi:hypothetical protein TRVL_08600 [Trypanosoma vivax]|uniref:Uncharacterized protein n=1 Tax=Trypanosoma vivax (strain Y486) TaxID=1055687 RepID=G0TS03_TRYVY|nr:hypothetical protein TRVL_08600 [Trypanosoma vivax]CCC46727.1 conserved hypothetical protein [Trypanosoma vivax Y486]